MTVHITINVTNHPSREITVNDAALEAVRFNFNPSLMDNVTVLKALAAAFLTKCDEILMRPGTAPSEVPPDWAGREISVAKTNMQTASMWAVLGATKGS
jgi:hypothetical protein